jgi:hypothetical protein
MKKTTFYFLMLTLATSTILTSCKKDEEDDDNNNAPAVVNVTDLFNYSDALGVLVGVKTVTTQNVGGFETSLALGTAVAVFPTTAGATTFADAGTVINNTKTLSKQNNNSYVFTPATTDVTGIDFSGGSEWEVSGSSNVPAFNYTYAPFPSNPKITSSVSEVNLANGYNFTLQNANSNADSVLFILASGSKYVSKTLPGNATSANFSASDLATLTTSSQGLIQVTPYKIKSDIVNGKKYYFINQVTVSNFANFTN